MVRYPGRKQDQVSALLFVIAVSSPLDQWCDFVVPHSVLAFFEVSVFDRSECSDLESLWMEDVWISPSTPCVITAAVLTMVNITRVTNLAIFQRRLALGACLLLRRSIRVDCSSKTPSQSLTSFRVVMRTRLSLRNH